MSARTIDPRRYNEAIEPAAMSPWRRKIRSVSISRRTTAETAVHHLPAPMRTSSRRRHELGAFTRHRRSGANIARVVLHGVGEPMLVKDLPRMIPLLKDRRRLRAVQHQRHCCYGQKKELCEPAWTSCGLPAPDARTFLLIRGKDYSSHRAQRGAPLPRCRRRS